MKKQMNKKNHLKEYITFMNSNMVNIKKYLPYIVILSLVLSIVSFFIAIISKNMIDYLLDIDKDVNILIPTVISLYVLSAIISYGYTILHSIFYDKYKIKIQKDFYENLLTADYVFFISLGNSDIYYRMFTDISTMVQYYIQLIVNIPIKFLVLMGTTIILVLWSPVICLLFYVLVLLQMILVLIFKNKIKKNYKVLKEKEEALIQDISENCQRIDIIRSLNLVNYCTEDAESSFEEYYKQDIKLTSISKLHNILLGLISQLWNVVILIVGVQQIVAGNLSIGTLMGISILATYLSSAINEFFNITINYQSTIVCYDRFCEYYNRSTSTATLNNPNTFSFNKYIDLKKITYSYSNNEKTVFYNFNLRLNKDSIYLIKGPNGSGKTTLSRLIARFITPQTGDIYIDDKLLSSISENSFRKNVIYVNSYPMLLNKSIYENIVLNEKYSESEFDNIIELCRLQDVINKHGKYSPIGLRAGGLSQGEVQKVSLARAFIRKPQILILDEPTAHVDYESAIDLIDAIKNFQTNNHSLIIICSHDVRLNSVSNNIVDLAKNNSNIM